MKLTNKKSIVVLLTLIILVSMIGCNSKKDVDSNKNKVEQNTQSKILDREGKEIEIKKEYNRIISTAPSNTDILLGLGLKDKIIAVDKYSKTDELNKDIPTIDFSNPDPEAIIALNPDILIASTHNKVGENDPFATIKEAGIIVTYIPVSDTIDGIYKDIEFLSQITKTKEKGKDIIDTMRKEIESIKSISNTVKDKKKVYLEIGSNSKLYSTGANTFLNELLTLIGAENIFADKDNWIEVSAESVVEKNPDVIITTESNKEKAVDDIISRTGFNTINAVKNKKVYLINGDDASQPSQNVVKAIKELAKAVYPEYYE